MAVNVEQMKQRVLDEYGRSDSWTYKVKKMSDNQIIALYYKFQNKDKK